MFERRIFSGLLMLLTVRHGARGGKMVELNEGMAGRPVAIALGEQVRVTLAETGGTGYRWRVAGCEAVLHLDEDQEGAAGTTPGVSHQHIWVYTARGEGSCELRFESARSWEKTVTGKTVSFPVTVHEAG